NCTSANSYQNTFEIRMAGNGKIKLSIFDNKTKCSFKDSINITFENPISNNTISKQGGCSSLFTINGSTPSGGNGSFRYLWYAKGNNSGWEELLNEKSKDITQKSYNNAKYFVRVVKSGNCITSS